MVLSIVLRLSHKPSAREICQLRRDNSGPPMGNGSVGLVSPPSTPATLGLIWSRG